MFLWQALSRTIKLCCWWTFCLLHCSDAELLEEGGQPLKGQKTVATSSEQMFTIYRLFLFKETACKWLHGQTEQHVGGKSFDKSPAPTLQLYRTSYPGLDTSFGFTTHLLSGQALQPLYTTHPTPNRSRECKYPKLIVGHVNNQSINH